MYYLSQFCYCCLGKSKQLLSINDIDTDNTSYKDKFKFCYLRTDNLSDDIPQLICETCREGINFVFKFRKQYLERRERLRGYITDLKQANQMYPNSISRLSIDVLNIDKFLSSNPEETINLKAAPFYNNSQDENIVIKCEPEDFLDQTTNEIPTTDEDLYDVDVQTLNFTLNTPFGLREEVEDSDSNNLQEENYGLVEASSLQDASLDSVNNYEIVKNSEEKEAVSNGEVFNIANNDNNILRIVRQKEVNGLKIVIRKSHRESSDCLDVNTFVCNICDKSFQSIRDLNLHLPSHDTKTEFECIFCDKIFSKPQLLRKHERTHPNKPYNCKICKKQIQQKLSYRTHMSKHTGDYKFKCDVCGKGLASKFNLIYHKLTHYKEKISITKNNDANNSKASFTPKKSDEAKNYHNGRYKAKIAQNSDEYQKETKPEHNIDPNNSKASFTPKKSDEVNKYHNGRYKAKITQNLDEYQKTLTLINGPKRINIGRGRPKKQERPIIRNKKLGRPFKIQPTNDKRFYCVKCSRNFVSKYSLEKHTFRFHTIHECPKCHQKFKTKFLLGLHRRGNLDCKKPQLKLKCYICEICDKKFRLRKELKQHLKTHVDDTDDEELSELQYGGHFLNTPNPTNVPNNSEDDTTIKYNIVNNKLLLENPKSLVKCLYCDKSFINQSQLDLHLLVHTGVSSFKCTYPNCLQRFASSLQVQNHISRMHKKTLFDCKICTKRFKIKHNLNKHMIAFHVNEAVKHQCDFCDKKFIKLSHLRRHIRSHSIMERTYSCSECHKVFFTKGNLIRHLVIHTNEMSYECNICSKRFNLAHSMLRHMKSVHDDIENFES